MRVAPWNLNSLLLYKAVGMYYKFHISTAKNYDLPVFFFLLLLLLRNIFQQILFPLKNLRFDAAGYGDNLSYLKPKEVNIKTRERSSDLDKHALHVQSGLRHHWLEGSRVYDLWLLRNDGCNTQVTPGVFLILSAKTCPATMVYRESSSPCMDTCSHLQISSLCEEHYMDGCFCPEGKCYSSCCIWDKSKIPG